MSKLADAITEALGSLPEAERAVVIQALAIGGDAFHEWRDRYGAADRAMLALGAVRVPPGRRRRTTLYRMTCGCRYVLEYGQPMNVTRCPAHPLVPLRTSDVAGCVILYLGAWVQIALGALVITAALVAVGVIYSAMTGELDFSFLRLALLYWGAVGLGFVAWKLFGLWKIGRAHVPE